MDLVNTTPVPAELLVGAPEGWDHRLGALVAKATFRVADGRLPELETQDPLPILRQDEETELGLRPRDDLVRRDEVVEVILLGAAYAPNGRAVPATTVSLSVGRVQRTLLVVGDRQWEKTSFNSATMSRPEPFKRMPMTWARAFGGTAQVEIDEETLVDVSDPRNRDGRGFDAQAAAKQLAKSLDVPDGYPVLQQPCRRLPNLEAPGQRITHPGDAPDPVCWATLPMHSGLHALRSVEGIPEDELSSERLVKEDALLYRAHPDWVIGPPPEGATVTLVNATPGGQFTFPLPSLRVIFDYVNAGRTATRILPPQMLVLYAEEKRLTITYRKPFTFPFEQHTERCLRLRIEHD